MKCILIALLVSAGMVASCFGQLTIINPKHLIVPEEKAEILISTARRVVTETFPLSDHAKDTKFPVTLELGQKEEHYSADDKTGTYILYLEHWDESKFTVAVTNLAIQQFVVRDRLKQMVTEILRRSAQIAPVPVPQLHGNSDAIHTVSNRPPGCLGAATDATTRNVSCGPTRP